MKNKTVLKIILDTALFIVFILLMNAFATGLMFHEIAGIAVGLVFLVHMLLNTKWIKSVTKNIFGKKIIAKTRIKYILDVLLLFGIYTIIITGILMSEALFPHMGTIDLTVKTLHTVMSYVSLALIIAHIGMHWKWIKTGVADMFKLNGENKGKKWVLRGTAFALAVWGAINIVTNGVFGKIGTAAAQVASASQSANSNASGTTQTVTGQSKTASDIAVDNSVVADDTQSVDDYLSNLFCTACGKHCSLLSPQCGRGVQQQQNAIQEFEVSAKTAAANKEAVVYKEDGTSYLQLGAIIYTIGSSA